MNYDSKDRLAHSRLSNTAALTCRRRLALLPLHGCFVALICRRRRMALQLRIIGRALTRVYAAAGCGSWSRSKRRIYVRNVLHKNIDSWLSTTIWIFGFEAFCGHRCNSRSHDLAALLVSGDVRLPSGPPTVDSEVNGRQRAVLSQVSNCILQGGTSFLVQSLELLAFSF